jgi:hypothetical protein
MNEDITPQKFTSISEYLEARGYTIKEDYFVNPSDEDDKVTYEEYRGRTPMTLAEEKGWKR